MFNWRKPVIYLLLCLSGNKIPQNLSLIKKLDKLSLKEKKKYQDRKLKKLLIHAYKNVPYYSRVLKEVGVIINNNVVLENLKNIPVLTKDIIRKEGENLYSKDYKARKFYENTSGGSTGEPVRFIQDKNYEDLNNATKIYYKLTVGQDIGDKELRFWGSERDLLEGKEKLSIRLRNWLYNRREFNTFKMTEKEMFVYVEKWNKYNPFWIEAYIQSMYEFAKFIEKKRLKIKSPENGILTSAGTLFPEMKETIERVFKCKVYNRYGSREVGGIAFGENNLNISYWSQKIEVVEKDEISGKIIVTGLNNFSMPLIRYDIGDIGTLDDNEMMLKEIKGRVNSMIETSKGKVDSAAITSALYFDLKNNLFTSFSKYQLIQKKKDVFELKIVVIDKSKWEKDKDTITTVMKSILGKDIIFNFNEVESIESLKNGKYEYIKSEII